MVDAGDTPATTKVRGTPVGDAAFTIVTVLGGGLIGSLAARDTLRAAYNGILESPGPYAVLVSLLFGFTLAVAIVWQVPRGRERVGALLALPCVVLFVTWIAGAHRLEATALHATPDLELLAQVERSSMAASDGAAVWTFGAFFAAILFMAAALALALRGRARARVRHTTGRRVASWIVGFVAIVATAVGIAAFRFLPLSSSDRAPALAAVLPSALGVLCIYLAAGALREGPRTEVGKDIVLSFAATVGAIVTTAMMAALGMIAQASTLPLSVVIEGLVERRGESMALFLLSLAFVLPPLLALVVALGLPRRAWFDGVVRQGVLPVAVALVMLLGPRARAFRAFVDASLLPRALTQEPLRGGSLDGCNELVSAHLVKLGPAGVTGAVTVPSKPDGSCDEAALAIDALAKDDDAYLTVEPATPFARVGCIIDALARLRAPRVAAGASGRRGVAFPGCAVRFVGQHDGDLACKRVPFADPRCAPFDPTNEPDRPLDIELTSPALVRWTVAGHTWKAAHVPLADLAGAVLAQWKAEGQHRDESDQGFDVAIVRGNPTDSFAQTMDHLATVESVKRKLSYSARYRMPMVYDERDENERPALDVKLASLDARFTVFSEAALPPWPELPATHAPQAISAAKSAHEAALGQCRWAACSYGLEARHRAALGELSVLENPTGRNDGRLVGIDSIRRALSLDPSVMPTKTTDSETTAMLAVAWNEARALPQPAIVFDAIDLSRVSDLSEETLTPALAEVRNGLAECAAIAYPAGDGVLQSDVTLSLRDGRVVWASADPPPREPCLTSVLERVVIPGSHVTGDVTVRIVGKFRR
ncbi:MAG: hypothetical protein JWM74_3219 [Myxococcaceae bacterium]|nr:hypothetical protein [Myxococcaceae bacterium]